MGQLNLWTIGIIIITALIGIFDLLWQFYDKWKRHSFAVGYLNKFREFSTSYLLHQNFDSELYEWLTYNSVEMQIQLGNNGIIAYRPAFANYMINGYQIIVNTLPTVRTGTVHRADIAMVDDSLMRHIGRLEATMNRIRKKIFNPLLWLRVGIQNILTIPFWMFYLLGIFNYSVLAKIKDNMLIKIVSALIIIIGLIGSIITITLGWQKFIELF